MPVVAPFEPRRAAVPAASPALPRPQFTDVAPNQPANPFAATVLGPVVNQPWAIASPVPAPAQAQKWPNWGDPSMAFLPTPETSHSRGRVPSASAPPALKWPPPPGSEVQAPLADARGSTQRAPRRSYLRRALGKLVVPVIAVVVAGAAIGGYLTVTGSPWSDDVVVAPPAPPTAEAGSAAAAAAGSATAQPAARPAAAVAVSPSAAVAPGASPVAESAVAAAASAPPVATAGTEPPAGAVAGSPQAAAGSPQAVAGSPQAVAGSPQAAAGSPQAAAGSPQAAAGSPQAAAGSPQAAAGSPPVGAMAGSQVGAPAGSPLAAAAVDPLVAAAAGAPPVAAPPSSPGSEASASEPAATALVTVRIRSKPSGATVTLIDRGHTELIGVTPVTAAVDPSRSYDLVFSSADRATRVAHLDPRTTRRVAVALSRSRSADSASRRDAAASAARRSDPSSAAGEGTLMVSSKPPCEITIDGEPTGLTTPQRSITLSSGRHKITLINDEKAIKKTFSVQIVAGATEKLIEDLMDR